VRQRSSVQRGQLGHRCRISIVAASNKNRHNKNGKSDLLLGFKSAINGAGMPLD